jgi:hypothetical protein
MFGPFELSLGSLTRVTGLRIWFWFDWFDLVWLNDWLAGWQIDYYLIIGCYCFGLHFVSLCPIHDIYYVGVCVCASIGYVGGNATYKRFVSTCALIRQV